MAPEDEHDSSKMEGEHLLGIPGGTITRHGGGVVALVIIKTSVIL